MGIRLTARARLTILYTSLVLAAGLVLTALTYLLMRSRLEHRFVHIKLTTTDGSEPIPPVEELLPEIAEQVRGTTLSDLLTQSAVALAVVTVLAAVLGWLVSGRVLRPIRAISATAQSLSAENLSQRVPVAAPRDELTALADTINGMLDRIELGVSERDRVLDSQKMFTANAAHELRTPLTTMRTAIDVTLDGEPSRAELLTMAEDVRTAIGQSQRTLDGLLTLAHSQAGPRKQGSVDLAVVASEVLGRAADEAAGRNIALQTDLRSAPVSGDVILLERMAGNLVDNALRYNHPGGDIMVSTGTEGGRAFLGIANTGRPITPSEVDGLLEPFVRGKANRTRSDGGIGLGLSIVRAIVVAHHAEISIDARPGGGLEITVGFPGSAAGLGFRPTPPP
ncbi:MAG TPA: histidine kinase [Micromonosporaceae bacterium]|nr:histidine kinase [Micromonosporaceae bacterium]